MALCTWGQPQVDSLIQVVNESKLEAERLEAMLELAFDMRVSNPEKAMQYAVRAESLATENKNWLALGQSLTRQGIILKNKGDFAGAIDKYSRAMKFTQRSGDSIELAKVNVNLGIVYRRTGELENALHWILKGVKLMESLDEAQSLPACYTNLATLYASLERPNKATEYFMKCLLKQQQLGDVTGQALTEFNLGVTYFDAGNLSKAEQYFLKSLEVAKAQHNIAGQARIYNSLGGVRTQQGNYQAAIVYYELALPLQIQLKNTVAQAVLYNNLATTYSKIGDHKKMAPLYHAAIRLAKETGSATDLQKIYLNLSKDYEDLGKADSALLYLHLHSAIKDSLFTEEKNRQIVEMQEKFESAQKDKSIAELNQEKSIQAADLDRQKYWLGGFGLFSLVMLLFGVIFRQKHKNQKTLATINEELNQTRMVELLKNNELKKVNAYMDGEAAERQRISGELHDRLGSRLATVKLHYDHLAAQSLDDKHRQIVEKANNQLGKALEELRETAHNLSAGILNQFGIVPALQDLCEAITATGQLSIHLDAFELEDRLPSALEIGIFRSVQELVSNTIKHAKATEVSIQLIRHEEHLGILVSDNGIGFEFNEPQASSGIGLQSIATRINTLDGSFNIDSQPNHGTTVVMELPIDISSKNKPL